MIGDEHPIEKEILSMLDMDNLKPPNRRNNFREYKKWLVERADELTDEEWDQFTEETQEWLAEAARAVLRGHWPPSFDDPFEATEDMQSNLLLRPKIEHGKRSTLVRVRELFCERGLSLDYDTASALLAKESLSCTYNSFCVQKAYFQSIVEILQRYGYMDDFPVVRLPEGGDDENRMVNKDEY